MVKVKLTQDVVEKVAKLANLPLSEKEIEAYSQELPEIIEYFEKLSSCQTESIEPTFNTTELVNVLREDTPSPGLAQEEALKNAKITKNGLFATKKIIEK